MKKETTKGICQLYSDRIIKALNSIKPKTKTKKKRTFSGWQPSKEDIEKGRKLADDFLTKKVR